MWVTKRSLRLSCTFYVIFFMEIIVKEMCFTIQIIVGILLNLTHAGLHITYDILNARTDVKSYFNAATKLTSNMYVGAQCKVRRQLICEPLSFDWFLGEDYKNDLVYLMKSCVAETFDEKVTLTSICLGQVSLQVSNPKIVHYFPN